MSVLSCKLRLNRGMDIHPQNRWQLRYLCIRQIGPVPLLLYEHNQSQRGWSQTQEVSESVKPVLVDEHEAPVCDTDSGYIPLCNWWLRVPKTPVKILRDTGALDSFIHCWLCVAILSWNQHQKQCCGSGIGFTSLFCPQHRLLLFSDLVLGLFRSTTIFSHARCSCHPR